MPVLEHNIELDLIHIGNALVILRSMPDKCVHCIVTSPPYYGLRDYDHTDQLGMEKTYQEYINKLVEILMEARRVLRDDGTLWLNLGDSYSSGGRGFSSQMNQSDNTYAKDMGWRQTPGLKRKELIGIPWRVALLLQERGWYLRQDIIWSKPNPMPESVTDRCTKAHEYIFLLSKKPMYYYNHEAVKTPVKDSTVIRLNQAVELQKGSERAVGKTNGNMKAVGAGRKPRPNIDTHGNQGSPEGIPIMSVNRKGGDDSMGLNGSKLKGHSGYYDKEGNLIGDGMANKKSVWEVATKPFKQAHFATFPPELIRPCVRAACPKGGIVLDIFMGSGTTACVAMDEECHYIGIELNDKYAKEIALPRIALHKKVLERYRRIEFYKKQQLKLFES